MPVIERSLFLVSLTLLSDGNAMCSLDMLSPPRRPLHQYPPTTTSPPSPNYSTHNNTEPKPKTKYEDVPLNIRVNDNCDDHPEVTVTVYSDEEGLTEHKEDAAILYRKYTPNTGSAALLDGWGVNLFRYKYAQKCGVDFACEEADGRFFTVVVCAKDAAGWTTCAQDSVGVPLKPITAKHFTPEDQGNLFVVAEDTAFWKVPVNQMPFREENTDLDVPTNDLGRLCYASRNARNYSLIGSNPVAGVASQMDCARLCIGICSYFWYDIDTNECALFDTITTVDGTNTNPGRNIYAMGNNKCPPLSWVSA